MGFVSGFFLGFIVGIVLLAGWCFMMQKRGSSRVSKAADIKTLGIKNLEELKKLCGDNCPTWISFPEFERVKWLNKQLDKIWPSVAEAASDIIRESVEPVLEDYRPAGISSIKFDKLFLGNIAPQIDGIRLQSQKEGQVTMDLDFKWGGDPSIILGIQTLVGANLPIQLKDLKFFSTVRVIFKLSENIPCISAVVVALLAKPKPEIKYVLKVIGGSLSAVPGLADMIKDTVVGAITDQLEWPHRIVVPIGGLPVDTSDLELKLQGQVTMTVVRAKALKNMERIGKSDPYVKAYIRILYKVKTKTIDNNLNPEWNETFKLDVEDHETQSLQIEVMDEDIGQDKVLGVATYPLCKLEPEVEKEVNLYLISSSETSVAASKKDRGTVTLILKYHIFSKEEQEAAMESEKRLLEEKRKAKEAGLIGSTLDAVGGVVGGVGGAVGGAGKFVVGGVVGGAGLVGTGLGKAGKLVTKNLSSPLGIGSKRVKSPVHENGMSR